MQDDERDDDADDEEGRRDEGRGPEALYRKEGDRVVGVCGARDKGSLVHLGSLYILPDSQGKGIGSMLMQELLEWTGPDKTLSLHVATYNKNALSFYEKWGFEDTGKRLTEDRFRMASGNSLPELEMARKAEGQI